MKTQSISLKHVLEDTRFQFRESSLGKNVPELKRLLADGIDVDPVVIWEQDQGYLILDGFQRVEAARAVRGVDAVIKAKVASFPKDDYRSAFLYAISANQKHGAQLEKPDRAKMARAMLKEFPKFSNVQIAKRCGLAESTVRGYRSEMPEAQSPTRLGVDGREISLPKESSKSKKHTVEQSNEEYAETDNIDSVELNHAEPTECKTKVKEAPAEPYTPSDLTVEDTLPPLLHEHPELRSLGIDPSELTGHLNDFMDELDQLRSYLEGLPKRSNLSDDDIQQAQAIQAAIKCLHAWRHSMFVPEDSEVMLYGLLDMLDSLGLRS